MLIRSLKIALLLLVAWGEYAHAQVTISTTPDGDLEYKFQSTKALLGFQDSTTNFRFFWHFGDEQYHLSSIFSFPNTTQISHSVIHNPPVGFNTPQDSAYVEITALTYTDTAEPERESFSNVFSASPCTTCNSTVTPHPQQVDLLFNRSLVKGHRVTLIVPYRRKCGGNNAPSGTENIALFYDSDQINLENGNNERIHGAGLRGAKPTAEFIFGPASSMRRLKFNVTPTTSTQYLYIPMRVSNSINPPQAMDIRLTYDFATCKQEGKEVLDNGTVRPGSMLAFSHDPNTLESPSVFICDCEVQDTVRYVVKFQNVGMAAADTVIIKDIIPEAYDINSINIVYPKVGNAPPPKNINTTTREVTWTLAGDFLKGPADLLGTASGAAEELTIDSLVFGVTIAECDSIKSCDAIFNQAEIIFDCNPSIYTNPHLVRFGCKTPLLTDPNMPLVPMPPDSCTCAEMIFTRDTIILSASDSTTNFTSIPQVDDVFSQFNAPHRWYPTYEVFNSNDPNSKVFTPKTRSFFQVASTTALDVDYDCHRLIRETVIKVDCAFDQIEYELTCDKQTGQKDIKAWVPGNTKPLLWRGESCETTVVYKANDVPGTEMWLTVVDPDNNCAAERLVDLTECPKPPCWFKKWWKKVFLNDENKTKGS